MYSCHVIRCHLSLSHFVRQTTTMTTPRDASHVDNPFAMMKALRRTENSDSGSSSNGDNQSDNSALVSIGNTSFGFNFDGESNSRMETLGNSSDSDGGNGPLRSSVPAVSVSSSNSNVSGPDTAKSSVLDSPHGSDRSSEGVGRSSIASNSSTNNGAAAEESAERLKLIASSCMNQNHSRKEVILDPSRKRKQMGGSENSSGGYNSDEEDDDNSGDQDTQSKSRTDSRGVDSMEGGGKRKKMDGKKRQERNAREKERSFRISKQSTFSCHPRFVCDWCDRWLTLFPCFFFSQRAARPPLQWRRSPPKRDQELGAHGGGQLHSPSATTSVPI